MFAIKVITKEKKARFNDKIQLSLSGIFKSFVR